MITTKIEGFGDLAKKFDRMGRNIQNLAAQPSKAACDCGSTEFLVDDDLGEAAPVRCRSCGKVIGTRKDLETLALKQAQDKIGAAISGALGGR